MLSISLLLAVAGASRYPATLRLEPSPAAQSAMFFHEGPDYLGLSSPPCEASFSFVGKDAVAAYVRFAQQLFQPGAEATLGLRLIAVAPSTDLKSDGWHAVVRHELQLFDSRGDLIASWTVEGRGRVIGLGEGALPAAFREATAMAERQFEARFEEPVGVVALLAKLGVPPGTVSRRPAIAEKPPPEPPPPPEIHPEPRDLALYVDAGGRLADLSYQATHHGFADSTNSVLPGYDLRVGVAGWWLFAQAGISHGSARDGEIEHALTSLGGDLGLRVKLHSAMELAGGVGIYSSRIDVSSYAFGPRAVTLQKWQVEPDLMAALRMTPPFGQRFRLRATLEGRYRLASFETTMINDTFTDHIGSGFSFSLLLGIELPLTRQASR